jgi:hypothetical protein
MVTSAPRRLVKEKRDRKSSGYPSDLADMGMTAASIPLLSNQGLQIEDEAKVSVG